MSTPDFGKVIKAVDKVLKDNSIISPPVSPKEIAENYGISIEFVTFKTLKDILGFFDFEKNTIYVNGDAPYDRSTFTIAHELGHFILHKPLFIEDPDKYKVLLRSPLGQATDPVELEANFFAANLLVPSEMLSAYTKYSLDVKELADIFTVSEEVIRLRLKGEYGY